jgi:hypothetical protein
MAQRFTSNTFLSLFQSAFAGYRHMTGITIDAHPLAVQLQSCHSVTDIITLLQGRAQAFSDIQGTNTINESIETIISILVRLADDVVGLVP